MDIFALMFGHATYRYKVLCFYRVLRETEEPMFFAREKVSDATKSDETNSEEKSSEEKSSEETSSEQE